MQIRSYDKIEVKIYETREEMGFHAAADAASCIKRLLEDRKEITCMFAAAPSQNKFLEALAEYPDIDWSRINACHMDEYIGFEIGDPHSFNGYLSGKIFGKVPFKSVNLINGKNDPQKECIRYEKLLREHQLDIIFLGIGENGHIAFNDPDNAGFQDTCWMKVVELDAACRRQQVNDGCFPSFDEVPQYALTATIPCLMGGSHLFCMVPGERKAAAVSRTLTGPIDEKCPASIMRGHENVVMYLDDKSAEDL